MISCICGSVPDQPCCKEHNSPAHYVLEVKDTQIALCPVCVRELKESLEDCHYPYGNNKSRVIN